MKGSPRLNQEQRSGSGMRRSGDEAFPLVVYSRGPRRGKVLIMDDDTLVRDIMKRHLMVLGYEVVGTAHGQETVAAFQEARQAGQPFDAVILDLIIPLGWGGEQTLGELLKIDPGVKALVCSGTLHGPAEHYRNLGFFGVLEKPYLQAQLLDLVAAAVQAGEG